MHDAGKFGHVGSCQNPVLDYLFDLDLDRLHILNDLMLFLLESLFCTCLGERT